LPVKSDSRFIGVITNTPTTGITNSPTLGSDLLWIAIEYRERLSVIGQLVAEEVDEGGRIHRLATAYELLDSTRQTTISTCRLLGGAECYRGKTIHIREGIWSPGKEVDVFGRPLSAGKELATIKLR
jgi:hypothetical protein